MRIAPEVNLPLVLDPAASASLPEQLVASLRELIHAGTLGPGDRVPSSRALSKRLGVARGTIQQAYDQLLFEGYLVGRPGSGTFVHTGAHARRPCSSTTPQPHSPPSQTPHLVDLRPGIPDTQAIDTPAWRRAWRDATSAQLTGGNPLLGDDLLRAELAKQLWQQRGVRCQPDQIAITAGARDGLGLLLHARKPLQAGLEDPGYPGLIRVPERFGAQVVALPADEQGLLTEALPVPAPELVVVAPSHQYPLGGSLPLSRRIELLHWAMEHHVLVVEDDYDSELRDSGLPVPALAALGTEQVVLLGTFAKILTPSVGVGFVVFPEWLAADIASVRIDLGPSVSAITQRALANYLASGEFGRHLSRMRRTYRERRRLVVATLSGIPGACLSALEGGLHAVLTFTCDDRAVARELLAAGIQVAPLSQYWIGQAGSKTGLVIGFAQAELDELPSTLRTCRELVERALSPCLSPLPEDAAGQHEDAAGLPEDATKE